MGTSDETLSTPVYARVRSRIAQDIVSGHWSPGTNVTMSSLIDRYGVSQMPIREALQALQAEGAVELLERRGIRIPIVTKDFVADVYQIRSGIQAALAAASVAFATPAQDKALVYTHDKFCSLSNQSKPEKIVAANRRFHQVLDGFSGNQMARDLIGGQSGVRLGILDNLRRRIGYGGARFERSLKEHQKIVDAFLSRDRDGIVLAILDHNQSALEDMLKQVDTLSA